MPDADPRRYARRAIAVALSFGLAGCHTMPPDHPGNVQLGSFAAWHEQVQIVPDPPDATCDMTGTRLTETLSEPKLVNLSVKAGPVTVACAKAGFEPRSRVFDSDQTLNPAIFPLVFVLSGGLALAAEVANGTGLRYPPLVHVVLKPVDEAIDEAQWRAERRAAITERWHGFIAEQKELCERSSYGRDCRGDDFTPYIDADLAAF